VDAQTTALLALFVFLGFTTQTMIGFGAALVTLTLGTFLVPINDLVPLVVTVSLAQTSLLVWRERGHVERRLVLTRIVPLMSLGAAGGVYVASLEPGEILERILGGLVVGFAAWELWGLWSTRGQRPVEPLERAPDPATPAPAPTAPAPAAPAPAAPASGALTRWLVGPGMVAAGVTQGLYGTGGPLLVASVAPLGLDKRVFRATLTAVWLVINAGLSAWFVVSGRLDRDDLPVLGWFLPALALALIVGEWGHSRVDERRFRGFVALLLVGSGLALLI
jgi:uncharacterized protein